MPRKWRVTGAIGAVVIGLLLSQVLAYLAFVALAYFIDPGAQIAMIFGWMTGLTVFGLTTAAIYTWAVDGRVRFRRSN